MISDNLLTEILNQVYRNTQRLDDMEFPEILNTGGGTGIQDATYLVNSANPNLTNEVVVTATRGALIVGNATPAWAVTAHPGAANRILITDANDALWSANTLDLTGDSVLNGSLTGGGTVETGGFTGTIPATANFAMGAGTLTQATGNDDTIANHTHAITTVNDGTGIIVATIATFNASGQLTASDYFTNDGGQFGISGNELLTVDAAGLFKFTGIAGVTVENGDYIGVASDVRIKFDSTNGYIDAILNDAVGSHKFRVVDSGGVAVITGDSDGNGYFAGKVGIGTTGPLAKLEINSATATTTGFILQTTDDNTTKNLLEVQNAAGTILVSMTAEGKMGFGLKLAPPTEYLTIHNAYADAIDYALVVGAVKSSSTTSSTVGGLYSYKDGTAGASGLKLKTYEQGVGLKTSVTIDDAGNVGIGTTSPAYRLDIDDGAMRYAEMTAPSAPAANSVVIYAEDNGSGKTRLMALFSSGAAQQIAIQP